MQRKMINLERMSKAKYKEALHKPENVLSS